MTKTTKLQSAYGCCLVEHERSIRHIKEYKWDKSCQMIAIPNCCFKT